jgi:hypothetical protein
VPGHDPSSFADIVAAAEADAARLRSEGTVGDSYERELDERFELAAVRALRVPAFAERSAVLRRAAKRVVPRRARPLARGLAHRGDRALRRAFELLESRRHRR